MEETKLYTVAGRDLVQPSPPLNNLPPVAPKPAEPPPLPVFNRSGQVAGFDIPPYKYLEIPEGRWTHTDKLNRDIPRTFALEHLRNNPNFNVQIPYERFYANDEKHLTVACPIDSVNGWGRAAAHIVDKLAELRHVPATTPSPTPRAWSATDTDDTSDILLYPLANWFYEGVPENTQALMRKPYHPTKWGLALTIPSEFANIPCKNLVAMSMWETSQLPAEWELPLNQYVKHLIVPSKHQVELFRQYYKGDISVVPLGVDTDVFTYKERPQRDNDTPFTILCYGLLSSRKAPIELVVEGCYRAFAGVTDNWKLILKTRRGVLGAGTLKVEFNDPHIQIISADYYDSELVELCHQADCGVVPSRFEGYGLPFREMMATGLPVIVSANTGHLDDCDDMLNVPIQTEYIIPAQEAYSADQEWKWNEPNWADMADALRQEYETWKLRGRTQSAMGRRASAFIQNNRTWAHTANAINNIVNNTIANFEISPNSSP